MKIIKTALFVATLLAAAIAGPAAAKWTMETEKNDDGSVVAYAKSAWTAPHKSLASPNTDLRAQIRLTCVDGLDESMWLEFNQKTVFTGFDVVGLSFKFNYRIRFDDLEPETVEFASFESPLAEGIKTLFIRERERNYLVPLIRLSSNFQLETLIKGEGQVRFLFDLTGSTAAINKARASC